MSWDRIKNKPAQALEFAAVHDDFAWRKHHASRFGVLKNARRKYADDSLSRAFESNVDSIPHLFSGSNRVSQENPEYGAARFVVVWYDDEEWAILCNPTTAAIIKSASISEFKREKKGAADRIRYMQRLMDEAEASDKLSLTKVASRISITGNP